MASISNRDGKRRIDFTAIDGSRKTIRLGKMSQRDAEGIKGHVENLLSAAMQGQEPTRRDAEWLASLGDTLHDRIARTGLCRPREQVETPTLAGWVERYIEDRKGDVKASTRTTYQQAQRLLVEFFGKRKRLAEITEADAEAYRRHLRDQGLAEATIRKRCSQARQFFKQAVKRKVIPENPFRELPCSSVSNPSRYRFVTPKEIDAVIEACPDVDWRLLFALARYGGVRVPSEAMGLRWGDIDWDKNRICIRSPKTEHQGKPSRTLPLFPELRPLLMEAFEQAEDGAEFVIGRYRDASQNLRTHACRIIRRAGMEPWPKLFQNLRSSRETELAETYPIQVVCAWIGNSPQVAAKHYLQVTDDHFERAAGRAAESAVVAPRNPPQQAQAGTSTDEHKKRGRGVSANVDRPFRQSVQVTATRCEDRDTPADGPYWTRTNDLTGVIRAL